jgi:hypothetical protein
MNSSKRDTFLYECPSQWVPLPTTENTSSVLQSSTAALWLLIPVCPFAHARLLPKLSWSWIVLLPVDTYRKLLNQLQLFYFHFDSSTTFVYHISAMPATFLSISDFLLGVLVIQHNEDNILLGSSSGFFVNQLPLLPSGRDIYCNTKFGRQCAVLSTVL